MTEKLKKIGLYLPENQAQKYINGLVAFATSLYLYGLVGSLETSRMTVSEFYKQGLKSCLIGMVAYVALTYVNHNIKWYLKSKNKK